MQWTEVHEGTAVLRQLCQLRRVNLTVIHVTQHDVLEGDAPLELRRRGNDVTQRILDVDRHQLAAQLIGGRVNRDGQAKLLASLRKRYDSRKHANRGDGDVARADLQPVR